MCAQTLAAQGAKVYITGRRKEVIEKSAKIHGGEALNGTGGSIIPLQMDQNDKDSILNAVKTVKEADGYLNILCNNAGIAVGHSSMAKADSDDIEAFSKDLFKVDKQPWANSFETNVTGYYYVSAAFLPLLKAAANKFASPQECMHVRLRRVPVLIEMMLKTTLRTASYHQHCQHLGYHKGQVRLRLSCSFAFANVRRTQSKWSPLRSFNLARSSALNSVIQQFCYNSSKAATIQLTSLMATEFSRKNIGIRVNAICPGYFPSEMTTNKSNEENISSMDGDKRLEPVPAGRAGTPVDMAMILLDLSRNQYMTGQMVSVDVRFTSPNIT